MSWTKTFAAASCCLVAFLFVQGGHATFRLLQEDAASPVPFEPAEFDAAPASAPSGDILNSYMDPLGPQYYSPPEDAPSEDNDPSPYEEAAFPSSGEEASAPLSPEDQDFYETAAFPSQAPAPMDDSSSFDPRELPCVPSERTPADKYFTCEDFSGYYCLYDQFGETGEGCDGGKYRCEANAASNVVYGILASYPVPTAIYGYCKTSTDCEASQFCDFMPQRNFSGDNVYGNCVDFLVQGCLA